MATQQAQKKAPGRGEKRELLKQRYIEEGKKRRETRLLRKMGVKRHVDSKENAVRAKRRKLEDHFDMSSGTDLLDQRLLDEVSIEKLGWDIDRVIAQEGRRGHLIEEHSESQLEALRVDMDKCVAARTASNRLGTVKFESGFKLDLLAMTAPREIPIEELLRSTDPFREIRKTYSRVENLLLDVSNEEFSTMRAVHARMEAYRLLRCAEAAAASGTAASSRRFPRDLSKIFGASITRSSGDAELSRTRTLRNGDRITRGAASSSSSARSSIPVMSRLQWYSVLEELGCRSCHAAHIKEDRRNFLVMYFHIHEHIFLAVVFRESPKDSEILTWVNYAFLQREDKDQSRKFQNEDYDDDNFENDHELIMGTQPVRDSDVFMKASLEAPATSLSRLPYADDDDDDDDNLFT